jgi:hypothetical protein
MTAPSPDTAVPEMTEGHLFAMTAISDWARSVFHDKPEVKKALSDIEELLSALSSGRGVVVQREEIEEVGRLATDAAEAAFWADEARGKRAANRIAEIAYHWSRPPAEDRT